MKKNESQDVSQKEYIKKQAWGLLASINLYDCDPKLIKSPKHMKRFIVELCRVIKMVRYGETLLERFAEGALEGYSMMQFIETSSITVHFDEERNRAFIDIFSCKHFNVTRAMNFSKKFFKAKKSRVQSLIRD